MLECRSGFGGFRRPNFWFGFQSRARASVARELRSRRGDAIGDRRRHALGECRRYVVGRDSGGRCGCARRSGRVGREPVERRSDGGRSGSVPSPRGCDSRARCPQIGRSALRRPRRSHGRGRSPHAAIRAGLLERGRVAGQRHDTGSARSLRGRSRGIELPVTNRSATGVPVSRLIAWRRLL